MAVLIRRKCMCASVIYFPISRFVAWEILSNVLVFACHTERYGETESRRCTVIVSFFEVFVASIDCFLYFIDYVIQTLVFKYFFSNLKLIRLTNWIYTYLLFKYTFYNKHKCIYLYVFFRSLFISYILVNISRRL